MSQFVFSSVELMDRAVRGVLPALDEAVAGIGGTCLAADAIGIDTSTLSKSLDNSPSRPMRLGWTMGLALAAPASARRVVAAALVQPLGFGLVDLAPVTASDYERVLEQLGPIGAQILELARRGRR